MIWALVTASLVIVVGSTRLGLAYLRHGWITAGTTISAACVIGIQASLLIAGFGIRSLDPGTVLLVAASVGVLFFVAGTWIGPVRVRSATRVKGQSNRWIPPLTIAFGLAVALQYLWRAYHAARFPLMAWDGLMYHAVKADVWLQSGAIVNVPQAGFTQGYPGSGELNVLWFMLFTRNDRFADMASLPYVPLLILGTALVARLLGANRWLSLLGGLLVAATPAVFLLASTTYVDISSAATGIAAIGFVLLARRHTSSDWKNGEARIGRAAWTMWIVAGMVAGIAMGTKVPNTLVVVLPLVAIAVWAFSSARRGDVGWWRATAIPLTFVSAAAFFGASWYITNLGVHKNPVYPFRFGPFDGPLAPTDITNVTTVGGFRDVGDVGRLLWSWTADFTNSVYNYDIRPGGFGYVWPLLLLPALALLGLWLVWKRDWFALALCWFTPILIVAILPMRWWARLSVILIALGAASLAVVASNLRLRVGHRSRGLTLPISLIAAALAAASMVNATLYSNYVGRFGYDPSQRIPLSRILELSKATNAKLVEVVSPWSDCRGFETMRPGTWVATDGFRWPHLVVGQSLDRKLAPPLTLQVDTIVELEKAAAARGIDYVVLASGSRNASLAIDSPRFRLIESEVCASLLDAQMIFEFVDPHTH